MKTWLFWSPLGFLLSCHEKHNQSTAKRHGRHIVSAVPLGNGPAPVCALKLCRALFFMRGRVRGMSDSRRERIKYYVCLPNVPGLPGQHKPTEALGVLAGLNPWRAPAFYLALRTAGERGFLIIHPFNYPKFNKNLGLWAKMIQY